LTNTSFILNVQALIAMDGGNADIAGAIYLPSNFYQIA
jgi:hypothetical protein